MFLKNKKIYYSDRNNFKLVVCDKDYYEKKNHNGLPTGYCKLLETLLLKEYNDKDIDNVNKTSKLKNCGIYK